MAPADLVLTAATALAGAAVVLGLLVLGSSGSIRAGLGVVLDLLLAAGLLRLTVAESWNAIAAAAVVVGIRKLVTSRLALGAPAGGIVPGRPRHEAR